MFEYKPRELNYSKIKTYKECPYLFKQKYVKGIKEGLIPASSLGVSIHRTLEAYYASKSFNGILKYYNRYFISGGYQSAAEQMEYYLKGKAMLEAYAIKDEERKTEVFSTEQEFIFDYQEWTIRGKIDRIDKTGQDTWEVIDYKTDLEPPADFKAQDSLQLGIYSVGAKRYWNMKEGKASIYFVSNNTKASADFKDFNEEEILETFIKTGELILKEEFSPNQKHCPDCLMRNRCPFSSTREEEK